MVYELPEDAEVEEVILKILSRRGVVESQAELHREVMKHLLRRNERYRLSERRMRLVALSTRNIRVEIKYKLTERSVDNMEICPVCGSPMERISNYTLDGKKVVIGFRCTHCPYWTGTKLRVPIRYIFRYSP